MPEGDTGQAAHEVEAVLRGMLAAADRGDAAGVEAAITDDLLLYKVGRVRHRADMMAAVADFVRRNGSAMHEIDEVVTRVDGDLATMTFRAWAEVRFPGEPVRRARWLESVILRRTDRWRICFYHSTDEAEDEPR